MKTIEKNNYVYHMLYGRGYITIVNDKSAIVKFNDGITKSFILPDDYNDGEFFIINENDNPYVNKECKDSFKQLLNLKKELSEIDVNDILLINLYKKYKNEHLFKWILYGIGRVILLNKNGSTEKYNQVDKNNALLLLTIISYYNYDGEVWNSIQYHLKPLYDVYGSVMKLENELRYLIDANEKYNTVRQITNPLVHAFVPLHYLERFIDFVFDIYLINFNAEINDLTINSIVWETIKGITESFTGASDIIFSDVTKKTYTLIESTKLALIHYPEESLKIIVEILKAVDAWYHNRQEIDIKDPDLLNVFKKWQEKSSNISIKENKVKSKKETVPRAIFSFDTSKKMPFLRLPEIPIRDKKEQYFLKVLYKTKDQETILTYNEDYYTERKIGLEILNIKDIYLENPLGDVIIKVYKNDNLIYDTENTLHRNYLLFNSDNKEIKNNVNYDGLAFIVYDNEIKFEYGNNIYNNRNYKVNAFDVSGEKLYKLNNTLINFNDYISSGIYGDRVEYTLIEKNNNLNYLKLYKNIERIIFETNEDKESIDIKINNNIFKLEELDFKETFNQTTKSKTYILTIGTDLIKPYENNVDVIIKNKIKDTFNFFYDSSFSIDYYEKNNLIYDIKIRTFGKEEQHNDYDFSANLNFKKEYYVGKNKYTFINNPNILRFKLNKNSFKKLNYLEINENDILLTRHFDKVEVRLPNGEKYDDLYIKKTNMFETIINVSNLSNLKGHYNYVDLVLIDETYKLYLKETIVNPPKITPYENKYKIVFDIKCFKENNLKYEINYEGFNITKDKLKEQHIFINETEKFKNLEIKIYKEENIFLGDKHEILYSNKHYITDTSQLTTRTFNIKNITYSTYAEGERREQLEIPKQTSIKFLKKVPKSFKFDNHNSINLENDVYIIQLYKHNYAGNLIPFKHTEHIYAEVISERMSNIIVLYTEYSDGEGLGFDKYRNFILEGYDANSELIEYIVIDLKEMI